MKLYFQRCKIGNMKHTKAWLVWPFKIPSFQSVKFLPFSTTSSELHTPGVSCLSMLTHLPRQKCVILYRSQGDWLLKVAVTSENRLSWLKATVICLDFGICSNRVICTTLHNMTEHSQSIGKLLLLGSISFARCLAKGGEGGPGERQLPQAYFVTVFLFCYTSPNFYEAGLQFCLTSPRECTFQRFGLCFRENFL